VLAWKESPTVVLAEPFEQTILNYRPMPFPSSWANEVVFPFYDGLSIRNLPHTVTRLLTSTPIERGLGTAPLDAQLWEAYTGNIRRVVLFLTDGLGWHLLQDLIGQDAATAQVVADLTGGGTLTPITSVAPSTTAAALPTLWTGASPIATGMIGTLLFLREFGTLASLLHYWPVSGRHRVDVLEDWGLNFDTFLPVETISEVLAARQIPTYLLLQKELVGSGLSRVMHRGLHRAVRHFGYTDLWVELRGLLHKTRRNRCFVNIYWGAVDGVSHLSGTATEQTITEIRRQLTDLRDTLLSKGVGDKHTLFILAADHGHTPVPDYINVSEHRLLVEAMRCGLGGDGRFAYLYLRHDYRQPVMEYIAAHWGDKVAALPLSDALGAGLFGPEPRYQEAEARLGDLILVSRKGVAVGDRPRRAVGAVSRHGGLSDREMLVPLLMRPM
jgi:hypothetical protein